MKVSDFETLDLRDPRDFLQAYHIWSCAADALEQRVPSCWDNPLHSYRLCCADHKRIQATYGLLQKWARYHDTQLKMYRLYDSLLSDYWFAEFKKRAGIA